MISMIKERLDAALDRLQRYLSFFLHRGSRNWRTTFLRARIHELEQEENADIRYLRWQLTKLRAENTSLKNRRNELCTGAAPLFNMPGEELRQIACRYQVVSLDGSSGWVVVMEHCVFCGCELETTPFRTERDALLYAALLQTAGYQPKRNLSCPSCYEEYEKSVELSKD